MSNETQLVTVKLLRNDGSPGCVSIDFKVDKTEWRNMTSEHQEEYAEDVLLQYTTLQINTKELL